MTFQFYYDNIVASSMGGAGEYGYISTSVIAGIYIFIGGRFWDYLRNKKGQTQLVLGGRCMFGSGSILYGLGYWFDTLVSFLFLV